MHILLELSLFKQDKNSWRKHETSGDYWKSLEINDLKIWLSYSSIEESNNLDTLTIDKL